jgi:hypothetical protein
LKKTDDEDAGEENSDEENIPSGIAVKTERGRRDYQQSLSYAPGEEEFLAQQFYQSGMNYDTLFYGQMQKGNVGEGYRYSEEQAVSDVKREMLTEDEAKQVFVKIQYAEILGQKTDVSVEERRRFDLWIKFNSALFGLFERIEAVTNDVNYAVY